MDSSNVWRDSLMEDDPLERIRLLQNKSCFEIGPVSCKSSNQLLPHPWLLGDGASPDTRSNPDFERDIENPQILNIQTISEPLKPKEQNHKYNTLESQGRSIITDELRSSTQLLEVKVWALENSWEQ